MSNVAAIPPNATVYARNLTEKSKTEELIESLRGIFEEYGTIIDIVVKTNLKAKGQAFIVFDDVESATKAIEEVNGFELSPGKPVSLAYAKTRSDATVKAEGGHEEFEAHKRRRMAEKDKKKALEAAEEAKTLKRTAAAAGIAPAGADASRPIKSARGAGLKSSNPGAAAVVPDEYLPPNKILFVRNVPDDYDIDALTAIFQRFEGFKEVRLVPGRSGIAFVEYEAEAGAISAKENTAGISLGSEGKVLQVTYQRQ